MSWEIACKRHAALVIVIVIIVIVIKLQFSKTEYSKFIHSFNLFENNLSYHDLKKIEEISSFVFMIIAENLETF